MTITRDTQLTFADDAKTHSTGAIFLSPPFYQSTPGLPTNRTTVCLCIADSRRSGRGGRWDSRWNWRRVKANRTRWLVFSKLPICLELLGSLGQAISISTSKLRPNMPRRTEMFVQLEDSPHVHLVVLLVLGVDCVQFTRRATRREERRMEEACESLQSASKGRRCNVKVIVGIRGRGVRIGVSVVLGQVLKVGQ